MIRNRRGMVKVRFFARKDFIFRKLEKGYSRQMIFDEIGKELDCTYEWFCRLIKKIETGTL